MEGSVNLSRRGFLRVRRTHGAPMRPPWAMDEAAFTQACTRCDKCIEVCPTTVLLRGDGGFPTVDFQRGECTFCGACQNACIPGALRRGDGLVPWLLVAQVAEACLTHGNVVCRSCEDACEPRAIRFAPRLGGVARPAVNRAACSGCGACVAGCPTGAISMMKRQEGAMQ